MEGLKSLGLGIYYVYLTLWAVGASCPSCIGDDVGKGGLEHHRIIGSFELESTLKGHLVYLQVPREAAAQSRSCS